MIVYDKNGLRVVVADDAVFIMNYEEGTPTECAYLTLEELANIGVAVAQYLESAAEVKSYTKPSWWDAMIDSGAQWRADLGWGR